MRAAGHASPPSLPARGSSPAVGFAVVTSYSCDLTRCVQELVRVCGASHRDELLSSSSAPACTYPFRCPSPSSSYNLPLHGQITYSFICRYLLLHLQVSSLFVFRHFWGFRWVTREAVSSSHTEIRDVAQLMQRGPLSPSKPIFLLLLSPLHLGIILNLNLEQARACTSASSTQAKQGS